MGAGHARYPKRNTTIQVCMYNRYAVVEGGVCVPGAALAMRGFAERPAMMCRAFGPGFWKGMSRDRDVVNEKGPQLSLRALGFDVHI